MCKFLHIRRVISPYFHEAQVEVVSNKGGVTVAYELVDGTLRYAVARCSERDNFCRKTGRTLAAGRLKSDRLSTTVQPNDGIGFDDHGHVENYLRNIIGEQ